MKFLSRLVVLCTLIVSLFGIIGVDVAQALTPSPLFAKLNAVDAKLTTDYGQKIDLNNSDIRDFRDLRGFYPNLASKIIENAPYEEVEEVLDIPGLSEKQMGRLQANIDNFTVTEPSIELISGDDRINPGVY